MKIWVDADEFYPWYSILLKPGRFATELDVDEATLGRWQRALSEAFQVQDEIRKAAGDD